MKDLITSLVFMFVAVFAIIASQGFHRTGVHALSLANNPAFYPRLLALVLFILSVVHLIQSVRKGALKNIKIQIDKGKAVRVLKLLLVIVVYIIGINYIGYIASSIICIFLLVLIFDGKILQAIICAVGATAALYLVFQIGFRIRLPVGRFFEF